MADLELHREYDTTEALASLGLGGAAAECHDWRIGDEAAALLAEFGQRPALTHLTGGRTLAWRAPAPCPVVPPTSARAGSTKALHAFALRGEGRAMYLGTMRPAYSWLHPSPGRSHGGSSHTLEHAVPPELWSRLDPEMRFPALEQMPALASRIQESATRHDGLDALLPLVHALHNVATEPHQVLPAVVVPEALLGFHARLGRHRQVHSVQNRLVSPEELAQDPDGHITFYVENQGVYLWSVRADDHADDPTVYGQFNGDEPWRPEMPLSRFLVSVLLTEFLMQSPYAGTLVFVDAAAMEQIVQRLPRLDLPPWRFPSPDTALHAGGGVLAQVAPHGDGYDVYVGCTRPEPVQALADIVSGWDHRDF